MQALWWCRFCDFMRVQWRTYKATLCWLIFWLVVGAVLGIVTVIVGHIGVDDINYNLIDGNILNATSISAGMGSFIWQRILSLATPVIVVFVLACFSKLTSYAVFPVVMIHGYWVSIAIWWVFFYYSFTAILLLAFYLVWLLFVTAILLVALLWALQWADMCRTCRNQKPWGQLLRGAVIIIGVAAALGFFEYLVFWTVLGKIVYKPL